MSMQPIPSASDAITQLLLGNVRVLKRDVPGETVTYFYAIALPSGVVMHVDIGVLPAHWVARASDGDA